MYLDYLKDIVAYHEEGKKNATIPQRMMRPTPANIKAECAAIYKTKFDKKDLRTLTAFFEVEDDPDKILRAIDRCDRDRFKPLVNFLKGITNSTDDLNIELLAWLIDFPSRPFNAGKYSKDSVSDPEEIQHNTSIPQTQVEPNSVPEKNSQTTDTPQTQVEPKPEENIAVDTKDQNEDNPTGLQKKERKSSRIKIILVATIILLGVVVVIWNYQNGAHPSANNKTVDSVAPVKQNELQTELKKPGADSLTTVNQKADVITKNNVNNPSTPGNNNEPDAVNIADYINQQIPKSDIAILIINQSGSPVIALSNAIADLYKTNKNLSTATSLFLPAFSSSPHMNKLYNGDAKIISNWNLQSHADYIVIGKYTSDFTSGDYTKYVCTATLEISIISCKTKQVHNAFSLVASNPYDDKIRAENGAKEKLVEDLKINHLSL